MDMQACPPGSLPAGINEEERKQQNEAESEKSRKLYHPAFTPFQKNYMKVQRTVSFCCAVLGVFFVTCVSGVFPLNCSGQRIPIFFAQKRVGKSLPDGTYQYFSIYKFRTMYTDTPKDMPTHMLKDLNAFITKAGKFLRKTSLDELPQLFNVLKGNMNLVGAGFIIETTKKNLDIMRVLAA